jgi:phosphoribosylformylglycinamidine synthase
VGILADIEKRVGNSFSAAGHDILLIGETRGHLGSSLFLREILGKEEGAPPPVDLKAERANGDFVRGLIYDGTIGACHDLSDGGLLVALAEMTFRHAVGANVAFPDILPPHAFAYGEDQARYLVAVKPEHTGTILAEAENRKIPAMLIGTTGGDALVVEGLIDEKVASLKHINESWMPDYMNGS